MLNRRQLLQQSAILSLAPMVPSFLARTAMAAGTEKDNRILVVIQLDGGNDGLNTVVPYRDEHYARLRPKLKIQTNNVIKLNDQIGLHPALKPAAKLLDAGRMSVVQGVGYPNPNRSHFVSMNIWQSGRLDEAEHGQYGWLGSRARRASDAAKCASSHARRHGHGAADVMGPQVGRRQPAIARRFRAGRACQSVAIRARRSKRPAGILGRRGIAKRFFQCRASERVGPARVKIGCSEIRRSWVKCQAESAKLSRLAARAASAAHRHVDPRGGTARHARLLRRAKAATTTRTLRSNNSITNCFLIWHRG